MWKRKISSYALWLLIGLSAFGGLVNLIKLFSPEPTIAQTIDRQAESLALEFAEEWLTLYENEKVEARTERISPFLTTERLDWTPPTVSQRPIQLHVVKQQPVNENYQTFLISATTLITSTNGTNDTHRLRINVPIERVGDGRFAIGGEPSILPSEEVAKSTPLSLPLMPQETLDRAKPFIENFIQLYYNGKSRNDIAQFIQPNVDVQPINRFVNYKDIVNAQYVVLNPETKEYGVVLTTSVIEPKTRATFTERTTILFSEDSQGKLSISQVGRY